MALGEAESGLFGLFTNQSANVFEPMSAGFECLDAGSIQNGSGVLLNQVAEPHNRAQRLRTACVEGTLCPLAALLAQYRRSVDPITARGQTRAAEPPAPREWLNLPGSRRVCIPTCSMRSLKIFTQRLSQRTQTSRPISSGGAS